MVSALVRLPDGTLELTITIPWQKIKSHYDQALAQAAKTAEIKGFRKGKAPAKIVEQSLNQSQLYQQILGKIIPEVYTQAVEEQAVKPALAPEISLIKAEKDQDWQIVAKTCEWPAIKLGDYQEKIRQSRPASQIWTPDKAAKGQDKQKETSQEDKVAQLFAALSANIKFALPQILVDQEVNRMLARLLDQVNQLGLTIDQYLASSGKTQPQLRQEYQKQAQENLKLELILTQIADERKITVGETEIDHMIAAVPDEKTKAGLQSAPQREYIRQLLRKRKVIDNLLSL